MRYRWYRQDLLASTPNCNTYRCNGATCKAPFDKAALVVCLDISWICRSRTTGHGNDARIRFRWSWPTALNEQPAEEHRLIRGLALPTAQDSNVDEPVLLIQYLIIAVYETTS